MFRWLFVCEESKNGSFKFEFGPHQFNLKMQYFSQFPFTVSEKTRFYKTLQVFDWLAKWLIMSGYIDLRRPRDCRRSNVDLVLFIKQYTYGNQLNIWRIDYLYTICLYWRIYFPNPFNYYYKLPMLYTIFHWLSVITIYETTQFKLTDEILRKIAALPFMNISIDFSLIQTSSFVLSRN